jgi:hypothetical protein
MKMTKNFGLIVLIFLVLISLALIIYPEFTKQVGVIVNSIDADSPCKDIMTVGSTISGIENKIVKNSNEFVELTKDLEGVVTFIINNNPRSCNIPKESRLNITVTDVEKGGIKLGTDLWGGVYYLFGMKEPSQDLTDTIKQRSVKYGLSNTKIELYNDTFVKIITGPDEEGYVNLLTEQGRLEGRVIETIDFTKKTAEFMFNNEPYEMSLKDEKSVMINESEYEVGDDFKLDGVDVVVENISKNTTTLSIKIFDDEDLTLVQSSKLGYSRIARQGSGYVFAVPVELSDEASEDYEKTTKNLEVLINPSTGESYSKYPISIFIDEKQFISVPILSEDMGKKIQDLVLWSYSSNIGEATRNMVRLKTIIDMKSLPQELTLMKREVFKSTYGEFLTTSLLFVILIASVTTTVLFFVKFRKSGVASLPLILMVLSELVLILGILSTNWFALIIFCVGIAVVFTRGGAYNWKFWVGIFLFFVLIIGMVISKWSGGWVLGTSFFMGLIAVVLIGFAQNVFVGMKVLTKKESYTSSDYKNTSTKLWLFSTVFAFILIISYFIFNFIGFAFTGFIMVVMMGLWINLSLILPVYTDITKKFIK